MNTFYLPVIAILLIAANLNCEGFFLRSGGHGLSRNRHYYNSQYRISGQSGYPYRYNFRRQSTNTRPKQPSDSGSRWREYAEKQRLHGYGAILG